MDEIVAMFRQRGDRYIDQCDSLYAYLIEPFLILKEPVLDEDDSEIPFPSFMDAKEAIKVDNTLPPGLMDL